VDPVSCASAEIPPHRHDLVTLQARGRLGLGVGLGGGWQAVAALPAERRRVDVTYTTLDGRAYEPPYADIHHRDEVVAGLADGALGARWVGRAGPGLLSAEAGASLPFGQTAADPYRAAAQGRWHQHNQLGVGVPVPQGALAWFGRPAPWAPVALGSARVPVVANARGFRAPRTATLAAGAARRLGPRAVGLLTAEAVVEGPEVWNGVRHGGRQAAVVNLGTDHALAGGWSWQADLRLPLAQHLAHDHGPGADDDAGRLRLGPFVGLSAAWTSPRGAAPRAAAAPP